MLKVNQKQYRVITTTGTPEQFEEALNMAIDDLRATSTPTYRCLVESPQWQVTFDPNSKDLIYVALIPYHYSETEAGFRNRLGLNPLDEIPVTL